MIVVERRCGIHGLRAVDPEQCAAGQNSGRSRQRQEGIRSGPSCDEEETMALTGVLRPGREVGKGIYYEKEMNERFLTVLT